MSGKEAIIQKIVAQANEKAAKLLEDAQGRATAVLQDATEQIEQSRKFADAKAKEDAAEVLRRRKSVADLEVRKYRLAVKQQMMDTAFSKAHQAVLNMDDKAYLQLISKLLAEYAENGEELTVSKRDAKRITQAVVDAAVADRKVTLSKVPGDFEGGFVLSKEGYEKNVTLEILLQTLRQEIEPQIAAVLFEEK